MPFRGLGIYPNLPPPVLVADARTLRDLAAAVRGEPALGVDTESNSLYAYRERVCLIQLSTVMMDYVVDPLAFPDSAELVGVLQPIFANRAQQKIFHAAEYDIICLKRDFGFTVANLFDTMVAARTLGWAQLGLGSILETHFGVKMNKRLQRANWGQRPLTADLLDYARLDTHYLVPLRHLLFRELQRANRVEETEEEFARLERVTAAANGADPHAFWRINGARDLTPPQAAVLRELYEYRERQAQRVDRPPFKVMSDHTLVELARACPGTPAELTGLPGMTEHQIHRHGAAIIRAVKRGLAAPAPHPPRFEREADSVRERFELLHQWRKRRARARGVESDVILPKDALWELARRAPRTPQALVEVEHLGPWRRQLYGHEILEVINSYQGEE